MIIPRPKERGGITLRDYQQDAVDGVRNALRGGSRAPLLVSPTGSGKTVMFSYIAQQAMSRRSKVIILGHRREITQQISDALHQFGVQHGRITAGRTGSHDPIQVASVQTLARRIKKHPGRYQADLIIVDEAHHATSGSTWGQVVDAFPSAFLLGVTATPRRLDGKALGIQAGGYFDSLVLGPSVAELTERGYLCEARVFAPANGPDLSGVGKSGHDWQREDLAGAMDRPTITGDAVEHYRKLCHQAPGIAFCVSIAHAEHVAEEFKRAGYSAVALSGKTDPAERRRMIADLGRGQLNVLTSCDVVSEGTDIPAVVAGIMLRPTQSESLFLQQGGRILRPADDKPCAYLLDHAGNTFRHGLLTDERDWSLDGKKKRKRKDDEAAFPVKQCPAPGCYAIHKPAPACPVCGHVYEVAKREIEQVAGELAEVDPKQVSRAKRAEQARARTLDELIQIGRQRDYKNPRAWATLIMNSRIRGVRAA